MKRIILLGFAIASGTLASAVLRHATDIVRVSVSALGEAKSVEENKLAQLKPQQIELRNAVSNQLARTDEIAERTQLDPLLVDWLLGTNYGRIPEKLIPRLSAALRLQWTNRSDYVLVSKRSLSEISVAYNKGTNMLGDWVCGLLAITPAEQQRIELACAQARERFTAWATANLQRQGPTGDVLVTYVIPASPELANSLTNNLYSAVNSVIGPDRSELLWKYEDWWCRKELGQFAAVTNTLLIERNLGGQPGIWYGEGGHAGLITKEDLPGTFRNLFPGGWQEIAQKENFEFPTNAQRLP